MRPPPPATFADGLQLHVNPRSKSGYTRVESLSDGRFRVSVDNAAQIGLLEACMMMPRDDAVDMHVQGVPDERVMFLPAQGLDVEHTEQPLGIYATALEAATVYARHARMRVPQVALATALATAVALRCATVCSTAWPNNTISPIQVKHRDEQRMASKKDLVQDGPRPRKGRFQERSNEAAPEAAAEGWLGSLRYHAGGCCGDRGARQGGSSRR